MCLRLYGWFIIYEECAMLLERSAFVLIWSVSWLLEKSVLRFGLESVCL